MNAGKHFSPPFITVNHAAPHTTRAREILDRHPEVKQLVGQNPYSAVAILALVATQLIIGWSLIHAPWWLTLTLAYTIGACVNHSLWVLIHECTHHLIFRRKTWNYWMALVANLPMVIPTAASFAIGHLKHHKFLGDHQHDGDMASTWEGRLLSGGFFGRLLWQILYPIILLVRTETRDKSYQPVSWRNWWWVNLVVEVAFIAVWFAIFGRGSILYMLLSSYLSLGPHPLGMRWIQEHYVYQPGQETYSYYGPMNTLAFNIGYHNEHHDLPSIPWNRLPKLKRIAPEMYDHLYAHRSWGRMWLHFLFQRDFSLYRIGRGMPPKTSETKRAA